MKFHENKPVGAKFFLADKQTDTTKSVIVFGDYHRSTVGDVVCVTAVTLHKHSVHSLGISTSQHIQVCSFKFSLNYRLHQCSWPTAVLSQSYAPPFVTPHHRQCSAVQPQTAHFNVIYTLPITSRLFKHCHDTTFKVPALNDAGAIPIRTSVGQPTWHDYLPYEQ